MFLAKADWILNKGNTFSARYNYQNFGGANNVFFNLISPVSRFAINENATNKVRTDSVAASLTSTLRSNSLNEFRFQFARDHQDDVSNSDTPFVLITSVISGFGRAVTEPRFEREKRTEFIDNYSWNRGRHEFRTGLDMSVLRIDNYFPGTFGGSYSFSSISNFVTNRPTTYTQNFGDPYTHPNSMQYAFFGQDNWRVRPNLNLNFGVRYELETYDTRGLKANPLYPNTGQIPVDRNNIAPRFGFSWSPSRDGKMAIRGGYGIFYGVTAKIITSTAISGNGLVQQRFSLSGSVPAQAALIPVYPAILAAPPNVAAATTSLFVFDPNFVNPYVQQGSLAVERQISKDFQASVSYLMTKGTRLERSRDVNLFAPKPVSYPIFDAKRKSDRDRRRPAVQHRDAPDQHARPD